MKLKPRPFSRNSLLRGSSFLLLLSMSGCGAPDYSDAVPEVTQTQFLAPPNDLRGFRYCEILAIFRSGLSIYVEVYATVGLNDCPAEQWNSMNTEILKQEYSATMIKQNGPRYFLMNHITGGEEQRSGKVANMQSIEMRKVAEIHSSTSTMKSNGEPYAEVPVSRTTKFIFNAGERVYELISPENEVYRMQSYSQIVDQDLTENDLDLLAERLTLPEGWHYQSRDLQEDSVLIADGLAHVIQDELQNSYQKVK